jgi:uncharacterized protein (TIGR03067 family)
MNNEELANLQGEWSIVFLEVDGLAPAPHIFAGAKMVIEGNRFTSLGMGAVYGGTIELNPETAPKSFRMKFTAGPDTGKTNSGIYELEGDRWRICLNVTGGPAPDAFVTSPGSGRALETLNREPSGPPKPEAPAVTPPVILD